MDDKTSLYDKLRTSGMLDEFRELMFAQQTPYDELLEQLEKWNISSSMGALSRFKAAHVGQWSMERAIDAERDFLTQHGANLDEATRKLICLRVFNLAANPDTPTRDVLKMKDLLIREANNKLAIEKLESDIRQRDRALEQKDKMIEMAERKVAALEEERGRASDVMQNEELTAEEKVARWKQVFGR
jgi:hypothetical protein